jgi:hypothetical protein
MNVLTQERHSEEPLYPSPPARIRHLEFNDVRAGRLVAESIHASLASAIEYFEKAVVRSLEFWEVAVREVPFTASGSHLREMIVRPLPRVYDTDVAAILLPRQTADTAHVTVEDDQDDDVLVQWFVDQRAAAMRSQGAGREAPVEEAHDDDVMLTLRGTAGSTRSWRGGGTMRQR